jgi:hypothetical protein
MRYLILILSSIFIISCTATGQIPQTEIVIKHVVVEAPDGTEMKIEVDPQPQINRSMDIPNPFRTISLRRNQTVE